MSPIGPLQTNTARQPDTPEKIHDAAQQFEALLLGQILRAAWEAGGGFMGEKDSASDCALDFAEQQFAAVMARSGGLGLATLIVKGLER
jgi:Rod binding domain-containing protein